MSKLTKVTASKQSSSRRDIFQGNSTEPACLPHPVPVSNLAFGLSRVILKASWLGCSSRWDMEMSLARKSPHLWLSKHPLTYLHYQCIREFEKSWDHNPLWDNCFVFGMHFSLPRLASGKGGAVWIAFQRKTTWFPSFLVLLLRVTLILDLYGQINIAGSFFGNHGDPLLKITPV